MRSLSWMALAIVVIAFSSCRKNMLNAPGGTTLTSTPAGFGPVPIPAIVWWGNVGYLPFLGLYRGDEPTGDEYPIGFSINGKGFVCGSLITDQGNLYSTGALWEYDVNPVTWTPKLYLPVTPTQAASFVIGNDAYVIAANGGSTYRYDQPTDKWTVVAPFPANRLRFNLTTFAVNGRGYAGLGNGMASNGFPVQFSDWWEYDPVSNTWTEKHDFPGGARTNAAGFAVDNKGYVCSGNKHVNGIDTYPNDLWQYDPTTDTWAQKANMPRSGVIGLGLNGIVNGGGHYGFVISSGSKGCLEYYPARDQWAQLPDMPGGARTHFAAFMINRSIVISGGTVGTGAASRMDVWSLNWSK